MTNPADVIRPGSIVESDRVYHHDTQLTTGQILALAATNIEVLAAPPTGYATVPVGVFLYHDHIGTDYVQTNNADQLALLYLAGSEIAEIGSEAQCTTLAEASADAALYDSLDATGVVPETAAIMIDNNGAAEWTTGTGTISVRLWYRVMPMAAFT